MTDQSSIPLSLHATNKESLEEAIVLLNNAGEKAGEVFEEQVATEIYFDPAAAINTAYSVLGIISTIGGAVAFVDWIVDKVRDFRSRESKDVITIIYNSEVITISRESDPEAISLQLENLLNALKQ